MIFKNHNVSFVPNPWWWFYEAVNFVRSFCYAPSHRNTWKPRLCRPTALDFVL